MADVLGDFSFGARCGPPPARPLPRLVDNALMPIWRNQEPVSCQTSRSLMRRLDHGAEVGSPDALGLSDRPSVAQLGLPG
jgi:hypothetical protein